MEKVRTTAELIERLRALDPAGTGRLTAYAGSTHGISIEPARGEPLTPGPGKLIEFAYDREVHG